MTAGEERASVVDAVGDVKHEAQEKMKKKANCELSAYEKPAYRLPA